MSNQFTICNSQSQFAFTYAHTFSWVILAGLIIWQAIKIIKKYNLSWLWLILVLPVAWLSGWFAGIPYFILQEFIC